jgi:hypothetical protein
MAKSRDKKKVQDKKKPKRTLKEKRKAKKEKVQALYRNLVFALALFCSHFCPISAL